MSDLPKPVGSLPRDAIREIASDYGMELSAAEVDAFREVLPALLASYERVEAMAGDTDAARSVTDDSDRRAYTYKPENNPHNAWVTRSSVSLDVEGPLSGQDVALKDNVALAGVPMTCGWAGLDGYVPTRDATVATRLLESGATITGKLNMDAMAFASSGELSFTGPVANPAAPGYLAGGSSSGPAAAVASSDVDVAIGTDQAGSIRIPASFCGCVGLKPTHGLVPYTGIVGQGYTFDHVGPLAASVEDCARTLAAIAGEDLDRGYPIDPRQRGVRGRDSTDGYVSALDDDDPLTVGVLSEGFGLPRSDSGTDDVVRRALDRFEADDVRVTDVSIPMHADGMHVWACVIAESNVALTDSNGVGYFVEGEYDPAFARAFDEAFSTEADTLPPSMQLTLVLGRYVADRHHGTYHAVAQNLRRELRQSYDEALADVDVLALPTTPRPAFERRDDLSEVAVLQRAFGVVENTSPFDMTGHPAISVPCGTTDGLPVGLMFVADRFDEPTLIRAADRFETRVGEAVERE